MWWKIKTISEQWFDGRLNWKWISAQAHVSRGSFALHGRSGGIPLEWQGDRITNGGTSSLQPHHPQVQSGIRKALPGAAQLCIRAYGLLAAGWWNIQSLAQIVFDIFLYNFWSKNDINKCFFQILDDFKGRIIACKIGGNFIKKIKLPI